MSISERASKSRPAVTGPLVRVERLLEVSERDVALW